MSSIVLRQLETFGPDRCTRLSEDQATRYTKRLVRDHYENFTVVSALLPRRLRSDFANVYAFCRWADDLGDETGDPSRSLELLEWWRRELSDCFAGRPRHPVFVALLPTIRRHAIPARPFENLIDAFVQDQRVSRYRTWEELLDYCTRSADPVGRLVLYMLGYRDERRQTLSDRTCTALQLANFWQDVRRDLLERDRVYIPAETLEEEGLSQETLAEGIRGGRPLSAEEDRAYCRTVRTLVDRTWPMFREGRTLCGEIAPAFRADVELFSLGGESVLRRIERIGYRTHERRPKLTKRAKAGLFARAVAGLVRRGLRTEGWSR